jgi:hypothetical protein
VYLAAPLDCFHRSENLHWTASVKSVRTKVQELVKMSLSVPLTRRPNSCEVCLWWHIVCSLVRALEIFSPVTPRRRRERH